MPAKDVTYTCSQDIIDGLNGISAEGENGKVLFDVTGRRVSAMKAKGIYIVNGKKVFKQ
jgi:hypothetical protein